MKKRSYEDKFKSGLERSLSSSCLAEYTYEPAGSNVTYSVPHTYHPDFIHPNSPCILIEAKAYFIKGFDDCSKFKAIARDNPDKELVFLFSDPSKKAYPGVRKRADGTYMSLGEWCFQNKILYFSPDTFPQELISGSWSLEDIRAYKKSIYR
jgi:hypothetical protein